MAKLVSRLEYPLRAGPEPVNPGLKAWCTTGPELLIACILWTCINSSTLGRVCVCVCVCQDSATTSGFRSWLWLRRKQAGCPLRMLLVARPPRRSGILSGTRICSQLQHDKLGPEHARIATLSTSSTVLRCVLPQKQLQGHGVHTLRVLLRPQHRLAHILQCSLHPGGPSRSGKHQILSTCQRRLEESLEQFGRDKICQKPALSRVSVLV